MNTQNNSDNATNNTEGAAHTRSSNVPVISGAKGNHTMREAAEAITQLGGFVGRIQLGILGNQCRGEEGQFFIDLVVELANTVSTMPVTYQTEGQGSQALVYLHYFTSGADWYLTERDCESEQLQAFGLADLGYGTELGYISLVELLECNAELDLYWTPKKVVEIS